MGKKIIGVMLIVAGVALSVVPTASAYTRSGSVNGFGVSAVMCKTGNDFRAGTYANREADYIWVSLDGQDEWWADTNSAKDAKSTYVEATIGSMNAWSEHEVTDNGQQWTSHIGYSNGSFHN